MIETIIVRRHSSSQLEDAIEIQMNTGWEVVNAFCAPELPMWCALMIREDDHATD